MNRIGTDGGLAETLESFLCRQIAGLEVPERTTASLLSGGLSGGQRVPHRADGGAGRRAVVCRRRSCAAASHGCRRAGAGGSWELRI